EPEPELVDTGAFDGDAYFDVEVEYGKTTCEDVLARFTITNRGDRATLVVIPQLWFRNTWSWGDEIPKPSLHRGGKDFVVADHVHLGRRVLYAENAQRILFTENETNKRAVFGIENDGPYTKDAFHRAIVRGERNATNPRDEGTKCGA